MYKRNAVFRYKIVLPKLFVLHWCGTITDIYAFYNAVVIKEREKSIKELTFCRNRSICFPYWSIKEKVSAIFQASFECFLNTCIKNGEQIQQNTFHCICAFYLNGYVRKGYLLWQPCDNLLLPNVASGTNKPTNKHITNGATVCAADGGGSSLLTFMIKIRKHGQLRLCSV